MNVNIGVVSVTFTITLSLILAGYIIPNVFAQSDVPDFSNLFGGSASSQDKDQYTNVVANQTTGLSKLTNTQYGFEFEFPSTWEVLEPFSAGFNMEGIPVQVASVRSTVDDGIHDLLTISVLKPSRYLDTDSMQVKTSNLSPQEHAKIVTDLLPEHGFKVVRENPVTVAGMPAYRIEYTTYNYDVEVFVVKPDGTLYKLEFGTPMLRAPESLPVFNKMVNSFKFVNASNSANETQSTLNNQTQTPSLNNATEQSSFNNPGDSTASNSVDNILQPASQVQQFNPDVGSLPLNNNENSENTAGETPLTGQSLNKITLKLNSAEFQTIDNSDHQVKILVDYETSDSSLSGSRINGILVISDPDGNEIKTTSYPNGFRITESGIIQFASTIDEDIDTVNLDVHLTDIDKTEQISNSVNVTVSLDENNDEKEDNDNNSDNDNSDNDNSDNDNSDNEDEDN